MKYSTILVLALAGLLSISACSPYEDGPGMSLRGKKARLTGNWKLVNSVGWEPSETIYWTIERDGSFLEERGSYFETGTWEFRDDKSELVIFEDDGDRITFEILRLSNSELHLLDRDEDGWEFEQ